MARLGRKGFEPDLNRKAQTERQQYFFFLHLLRAQLPAGQHLHPWSGDFCLCGTVKVY